MKKEALLNFFLDSDGEEAVDYLQRAGIDYTGARNQFSTLLMVKKGELKIKKGELLQKLFDEAKNKVLSGEYVKDAIVQYSMAFRNMEKLSEEDMKILEENIAILKKMEEGKG